MNISHAIGLYRKVGVMGFLNRALIYGINNYYVRPLTRLPTPLGEILFLLTHPIVPKAGLLICYPDKSNWIIARVRSDESFAFPSFPQVSQLWLVGLGYPEVMAGKYSFEDFVRVEPGDTVVEVGAFVGGFTTNATEVADHVYAFEPSPKTFAALERNTADADNVSLIRQVAWNEDSEITLNIGVDPTDNSALDIDDGEAAQRIDVEAVRLDTFAANNGIDVIDFLKIDAEGAEPEVLEGAECIEVRRIAIDVSPERYGDSPLIQLRQFLEDRGYDVETTAEMIYARLAE